MNAFSPVQSAANFAAPKPALEPSPLPATTGLNFAGYAALFNVSDAIHDRILPGAFARSLRECGGTLPLLWQHRASTPIGTASSLQEDARGLRVIGEITDIYSRAASELLNGTVSGLSFGFRPRRFHIRDGTRFLLDVELLEISLVRHPLQHGARVHFISR